MNSFANTKSIENVCPLVWFCKMLWMLFIDHKEINANQLGEEKKRVHGENEEKRWHFRWFGWILTESHWNRLLRTHYMNMSNQYFDRFKCSHKLELKCGGVQIVQISNQNWIVSHGSLFAAQPNRAPFFSLQMWKKHEINVFFKSLSHSHMIFAIFPTNFAVFMLLSVLLYKHCCYQSRITLF